VCFGNTEQAFYTAEAAHVSKRPRSAPPTSPVVTPTRFAAGWREQTKARGRWANRSCLFLEPPLLATCLSSSPFRRESLMTGSLGLHTTEA
jgi:hypothetical protein